jgi:uracil-DNA glycosylase
MRTSEQKTGIPLAKPVTELPAGSLAALRREAGSCHACDLWEHATHTVFGVGPAHARVMLIGEQPGFHEDREGLPFVGPAGKLLDRALIEAGLDRSRLYLTNTVKHFKYEPRGKLRLHKRANAAEQAACRMWLAAELTRVKPKVIVALGSMAAQAVFGRTFSVTRERGKWRRLPAGAEGFATWHPSAVLRAPDDRRDELYRQLVRDLASLKEHARS